MGANSKEDARRPGIDDATRRRLERDWALPMSERLARVHEICKQLTAIAGAARRR